MYFKITYCIALSLIPNYISNFFLLFDNFEILMFSVEVEMKMFNTFV